jgi:hypothetical protein
MQQTYRAGVANLQEHLFNGLANISAVAVGGDRGDLVYEKPERAEVNALGYSAAKSAGSFRFRNNFLSSDVTGTIRSFPSVARRPARVCIEKSFPESVL